MSIHRRLADEVSGVFVLSCALRADHLAVLELIHPLTGIDAVPVCGSERIRQLVLTSKTVAAVLRLPVDRIACNADGTCVLLDKRSVVSSHSKERGYGLCRLHGTAETAVLPMIIKHERLVSMLLRPQRAGYIFTAIHHAAALVVEAQNRRHTVPPGRSFQCRRQLLAIAYAPGRGSGTCGEGGGQHAGIALSRLTATR